MNVRLTIGRNVIIYGEGSIPLPPGNESGSVLIANSATPGDASFKTLEDAGIAKQADLVQLAGNSITKYSEGMTLKDKQTTFDGDSYKIIQRSNDAWATRGVYNFGKSLILQDEPVSTNTFLNQRFLQAILSICLAGTWKVSDSDTYYIRRYYDAGAVEGGNREFAIELGAVVSGVNTLIAETGRFEYNPEGGLLRVPITGVGAQALYGNIKGYMIVDQSMLFGLNLISSISPSKSRISHISDLNYNIDDFKHSIFTQSLKNRFPTEISYNRFVNSILRLKIYGEKSGEKYEKIYLSGLFKITTEGILTAITVYFSVLRNGVIVDVLGATNYPVTNEITDIPLTKINYSGLSGILTLDLREPYKLANIPSVSAENLPYYEVINVFYEIEDSEPEPEPEPIPQLIDNGYQVDLKSGFKIRNTVENTDYTLHIDDTGIWSKSGRFGTALMHKSSFDEPSAIIYTFPIYINRIEELEDGEFLIFLGHNAANPDTSGVGVWRSFNNRTEFSQVIAPSNPGTNFLSWSTFIVRNQVIVGEYGSFTDNALTRGSRYLYYSSDNGITFTPILDLMNAPNIFPTQDGWKQCHIHGACIDPYWDRIWVCTGDGNDSKLLAWTDDLGVTWDSINLYQYTGGEMTNQTLQFISMYPLKNTLVIAPDTAFNYMFKVDRINKSDTPVIQRTWAFNNTNAITHLTNGYVRFSPADPLYILMGRGDNAIPSNEADRHNFILATFDGTKYWKIWEDEKTTIYPDEGVRIFKYKDQYVIEVVNRDEDGLNPIRVRHFASSPEWL